MMTYSLATLGNWLRLHVKTCIFRLSAIVGRKNTSYIYKLFSVLDILSMNAKRKSAMTRLFYRLILQNHLPKDNDLVRKRQTPSPFSSYVFQPTWMSKKGIGGPWNSDLDFKFLRDFTWMQSLIFCLGISLSLSLS